MFAIPACLGCLVDVGWWLCWFGFACWWWCLLTCWCVLLVFAGYLPICCLVGRFAFVCVVGLTLCVV